ncbi:hypothetical protein NU219Hw_g3709t1 [Hortaea werneckii]
MAQALRTPILASAALSICLSLAIIGCAGRSLSIFDDQQASNAWLLPIWPNHFDTRELHALIGTSAAVMILNFILIATLFIQSAKMFICITSAPNHPPSPRLLIPQHNLCTGRYSLPSRPERPRSETRYVAVLDVPME